MHDTHGVWAITRDDGCLALTRYSGVRERLVLRGRCVPVTVGVTAGRSLVDPSQEEERQQEGALTCVWDASSDELLFVSQVTLEPVLASLAYCKVCVTIT